MKTLSIGKFHGLLKCSTASGALVILSVDHRGSLRSLLSPDRSSLVTDNDLMTFKLDVVKTLGDDVSGIILDPQYGAGQMITHLYRPKTAGLIIAVEASGYSGTKSDRCSQVLTDWSVAKATRMGADAIRLLVYYHPEADSAPAIESLVDSIAQECHMMDRPLFLAAMPYSLKAEDPTLSPGQLRESVIETARILTNIPNVDVYMTVFPTDVHVVENQSEWETACADLSQASRVPWVLISSGVVFDVFLRMVEIACRQGASGAADGRAAWQEAVSMKPKEREMYLHRTGRSRLSQLAMTCDSAAVPWMKFHSPPELTGNWYEDYSGFNNHF
ncbi:MAG: tagatose 1,6-diphosphate aldolase [Anaerolineaceae bacterium]|nr:tagatose 1,6-diphosphate aldolase [Anaerolineaceae bacterium]